MSNGGQRRSSWRVRRTSSILVVVPALLVSACSGGVDESAPTSSTEPSNEVLRNMEEAQSARSAGDVSSAVDGFDAVLDEDPANRVALFNLGILRRAQGDFEGSVEAWTELITAHPDLTIARYQRAITFRAAGDHEAAVADLRIVVEEEPDNKDALDQLGTLLIALGEIEEGQEFLERAFVSATTIAP